MVGISQNTYGFYFSRNSNLNFATDTGYVSSMNVPVDVFQLLGFYSTVE